jgi:hypothetical protein
MKRKTKLIVMTLAITVLTVSLAASMVFVRADSDAWTVKQNLPSPKADGTAAVYDGKLYVVGGYGQGALDPRSETYAYDPSTDTWTQEASMPTARWGPIAVEFNGKIYVFGGSVNVNEVYDPETDTWLTKGNLPSGFNQGLMGVRCDDKIHLFYKSLHYEYDPVSNTYTQRASMPTWRTWGTCAVVGSKIYVIGGAGSTVNVNEVYDSTTNMWTTEKPMPVSRLGATRENPVINGKIYVTHGMNNLIFYADNYMYDPSTDSWQQEASATYPRDGVACGVINDKLYVVGGRADIVGPYGLSYCEEYNPSSGPQHTQTPTLNMPIVGAVDSDRSIDVDSVTPNFSSITSPLYPLTPYSGNPVLAASMVTDRQASFVADPFMFHEDNVWYMFFEVWSSAVDQDIGLATSSDGFHWTYQQIVLDEPGILSYPYVFKWNGDYYMVCDPCSNIVEIYKATGFPYSWASVAAVTSSSVWFADPSLVYYDRMWWMFVSDTSSSNCYLYYATSLTGPWTEHPKSPVILGDASEARGGGRVGMFGDRLLRFVQKCDVTYGEMVRAFQVDTLTTTSFAEHEIPESPLVAASGSGWNALGMHTLDPWWTGNNWLASTDGAGNEAWSIGIYYTSASSTPPAPADNGSTDASVPSVDGTSISSEYSLTVNTQPISGLTTVVSNSSFTQKMLGETADDLEAGTYTIALPSSLTLHYDESPDVTWLFSAWSDGITTNTRQITLDKDTVLSAMYIIQGSTT